MKIRAILRFRNEDFTRKRLIAGFKSQKSLADALGINVTYITQWETFKNYPKKEKLIKKIESILHCDIVEIFPAEFIELIHKKIGTPFEKVFDTKLLPPYTRGEYLLPSPEKVYEMKELTENIEQALKLLPEREAKVLKMRFGLGDGNEHTLEEVGQQFKVHRERARQIEHRALRRLKYLSHSRYLRLFAKKGYYD